MVALQGKWGEDLYSPVPRPMFLVRLITVAGSLMFDPPLDTIEQGVLQAFDAIMLRSANVDEITTKVHPPVASAPTDSSKKESMQAWYESQAVVCCRHALGPCCFPKVRPPLSATPPSMRSAT